VALVNDLDDSPNEGRRFRVPSRLSWDARPKKLPPTFICFDRKNKTSGINIENRSVCVRVAISTRVFNSKITRFFVGRFTRNIKHYIQPCLLLEGTDKPAHLLHSNIIGRGKKMSFYKYIYICSLMSRRCCLCRAELYFEYKYRTVEQ